MVTIAIGFFFLSFSACCAKLNPVDPRVWLPVFGALYSYSFYILHALGAVYSYNPNKGAFYSFIFISTAVVMLWLLSCLGTVNISKKKIDSYLVSSIFITLLSCVLIAFLCYVEVGAFIEFSFGGGKRAIAANNIGLPFSGTLFNWSMLLYSLLFILLPSKSTFLKTIIIIVGLSALTGYLGTGQRDYVLKFFIVSTFVLLSRGDIKSRHVCYLGLIMLVCLPILKSLSIYVLTGGGNFHRALRLFSGEFLIAVLHGDWQSSGYIFDSLLAPFHSISHSGVALLNGDLINGLLPSQHTATLSSSGWYYQYYAPAVTGRMIGGAGYSYVGSWYLYFGFAGLILGGVVYSCFTWFMYMLSGRRLLWQAAYIVYVPSAIWALRGGFAGLLSALTKQSLLPAVILLAVFVVIKPLVWNVRREVKLARF